MTNSRYIQIYALEKNNTVPVVNNRMVSSSGLGYCYNSSIQELGSNNKYIPIHSSENSNKYYQQRYDLLVPEFGISGLDSMDYDRLKFVGNMDYDRLKFVDNMETEMLEFVDNMETEYYSPFGYGYSHQRLVPW